MGERERDLRGPATEGAASSDGARVFDSKGWLSDTSGDMRDNFARNRRVISFAEYLTLFAADPARQLRSAGQYVRDVFDHFGSEAVRTPMRRNTGIGGHQPWTACMSRKPATAAGSR